MKHLSRLLVRAALVSGLCVLTACAGGVNLGFSLPIGRHMGVGVNVGSDGRIGTGVGVGVGGGSVSVGTSGRLPAAPPSQDDKPQGE
ncbi:hypothetical protein [Hydrogenophaga sp.]|uniref:hypothetical protein n=1 Tax=Hydrogenophaga sp. TaxID=1904254 RepID=UPI00356352F0